MGKYIFQWWLFILLCLPSLTGQAQSTVLYFNEPPKETLGRNRNQFVIHSFFNDRDDFLWFISDDGLKRYDGHEIVTVRSNPVDLNSLSSPHVVDMIQDEQGNFWISTRDGGLNAYNPQTGKVAHFRHVPTDKASLSTDKLRYLQRDESGQIWIGSDWGMNQFNPRTGRTVRFLPRPGEAGQLQGNPLSPIIVERDRVYVSTTVGFEYYNRASKQWFCFPAIDGQGASVPNFTVGLNVPNSLCKDHLGLLWMGVPNQTGLRVFSPKTGQITPFDIHTADGKPIPFPRVILEDRSGRLWLCCENNIFRISADRTRVEECTPIAVENQERLKGLVTLYEDPQGLIWLERLDDKNPLFFDDRQERYPNLQMPMLGNIKPRAEDILHDPDSLIWIGTDLGLIRHNPNQNDTKFVLKKPSIVSLSLLADHYLLVISDTEGLFVFDKKTGRSTPVRIGKPGGKSIQSPICSALDQDGDLWISTWGYGLFRIPKGSLSVKTGMVDRYEQWKNDPTDPNTLASNLLQKIAIDSQNNVWVCGAANGLCRIDKRSRRVQRFMLRQGDRNGLASNSTFAPLIDKQGDVWVTSGYSAPLQRLSVKTGRFKKYGFAHGFTDDYFAHATLDEEGKIWFNQNHVVSSIDPVTEKVNTFPQFVGTSVYSTPIAARLGTGEVYFSCQNNLRRFTPALIQNAPRARSPLRLVAVSSFDVDRTKKMSALPENRWRGHELALSYRENTLEIKFALLDYRNTNSREYAYALTAKDEEPQWVNIGLNHTVDFAQMNSGSYIFHLKSRNSDGIWTKLVTPLRIVISPPWWLSPGAYVACALLLLVGFWYLMKARLHEQARELALEEAVVIKQQRDEIAQKNSQNELLLKEVHHRVKNNLGVVSGLLSLQSAKISDPKVLEAIQASQNRVQSMSIIHQKLYQGEQLGAIEMRDYFNKLGESILHSFDMANRIHIDCPMPELVLDIDTAISVGLIANELFTNSLKYAFVGRDRGTIRVSLTRMDEESLLLQVADNGIGKKPMETAKETGFGTQLVELLTRQLDGILTYENQDGTLVKLHFNRPATA
ncbi:MAG: histidine kinase dimerization/phosphoacceptor domain -containing protein [Dyadobacter sp.]|uniref:histidine kinase dimerization/phosphoacceptor domain -containing protein n=1 Tax=Dyadobacter sp. TaxID=1914288 RepID=UPI0032675980